MKSMYFVDIMKKFTLGPAGPPLQRGVLVVLQSRHLLFTSLNPLSCKICIFFPTRVKLVKGSTRESPNWRFRKMKMIKVWLRPLQYVLNLSRWRRNWKVLITGETEHKQGTREKQRNWQISQEMGLFYMGIYMHNNIHYVLKLIRQRPNFHLGRITNPTSSFDLPEYPFVSL